MSEPILKDFTLAAEILAMALEHCEKIGPIGPQHNGPYIQADEKGEPIAVACYACIGALTAKVMAEIRAVSTVRRTRAPRNRQRRH